MSFRGNSASIRFVVVLVAFCAYFVSISGDLSTRANIHHHAGALARFGTQIDSNRRGLA
jgi:hypothetical protein